MGQAACAARGNDPPLRLVRPAASRLGSMSKRLIALSAAIATAAVAAGCGDGSSPASARATASLQQQGKGAGIASTTVPIPRLKPLLDRVVLVDPGHNGRDGLHPGIINRLVNIGNGMKACESTGTETARRYAESAFNWDVGRRLVAVLRRMGARVVLTRHSNDGVGPCINRRAAIGNKARADAAISIHADGGPASGRGFHVIIPKPIRGLTDDIAAPSRRLGEAVRAAYLKGTGIGYANYIGSKGLSVRGDIGGLNLSDVPKVFIETGNMRNAADAALLSSARFRQRIANALAEGLRVFLTHRSASR